MMICECDREVRQLPTFKGRWTRDRVEVVRAAHIDGAVREADGARLPLHTDHAAARRGPTSQSE